VIDSLLALYPDVMLCVCVTTLAWWRCEVLWRRRQTRSRRSRF